MIHAVGAGSDRPPCLIDMRWGAESDPKVTLVGKGIVFDTGGLDIKPSSGMALMKKDMGGAANVLGLASMIMDAGLKVRLRVLIPAAENAISGRAFRPGDVLRSRKGLTVEIGNTDAEGRLVLADALALADEEAPAAPRHDGDADRRGARGARARTCRRSTPTMTAFAAESRSAPRPRSTIRSGGMPLWKPYDALALLQGRRPQPHLQQRLRRLDRRGALPAPLRFERRAPSRISTSSRWNPSARADRPGRRRGAGDPGAVPLSLDAPWLSCACRAALRPALIGSAPKQARAAAWLSRCARGRRCGSGTTSRWRWCATTSRIFRRGRSRVLITIYLEPQPHTVRALAAKLGVTKPVITRALDTMGRQGLVSRKRDPADRRNVLVQRTVDGALFLERLGDLVVAQGRRAAAMIDGAP